MWAKYGTPPFGGCGAGIVVVVVLDRRLSLALVLVLVLGLSLRLTHPLHLPSSRQAGGRARLAVAAAAPVAPVNL
jgi:hypothetical protein